MDWSSIGEDPLLAQARTAAEITGSSGGNKTNPAASISRKAQPKSSSAGTPKLYAISDLHLSYPSSVKLWETLTPYQDDGLILAGDIGESIDHLDLAFSLATRCFKTVWWCPGNHELYSVSRDLTKKEDALRGEAKYQACVAVARTYGVHTPEDDYIMWDGVLVAPTFLLYDYSFAPDEVPGGTGLQWAKELGVEATDERLLHADPYASKPEWCKVLVSRFEARLQAAIDENPGVQTVIVNHWPMRRDTVKLFKYPSFIVWCGTRKTEDWHERFNAKVVVTGHIHLRRTDWHKREDGWTRFEECSLGYPREWQPCLVEGMDINSFLREILPGPEPPASGVNESRFRRYG